MIFIIALGVLLAIAFIAIIFSPKTADSQDKILIMLLTGSMVTFFLIAISLGVFEFIYGSHEEAYETTEIAALSNGSKSEGTFFLATGTIKDNPVYYYMANTKDGMKLKSIDSRLVSIKETSEVKPNITSYVDKISNGKIGWLYDMGYVTKRVIYVPEGTVSQDFNVSLDNY